MHRVSPCKDWVTQYIQTAVLRLTGWMPASPAGSAPVRPDWFARSENLTSNKTEEREVRWRTRFCPRAKKIAVQRISI